MSSPTTARMPTTCQGCLCDCGLIAVVEQGRVVRVEGDPANPQSRGGMCIRGATSPDLLYAPDRLTRPLRRGRNGSFAEISWDRALEEIAERLLGLREEFGPESLCLNYGRASRFIDRAFMTGFARLFGTPNVTGVWSLCVGAKVVGYRETFGPPLFPWCDFRNARLILLWGSNPAASHMNRYFRVYDDILAAKKAGAKLVVVDPRAHTVARAADVHLALNPGTDLPLALALLRILVEEGGYDETFVARHTEGFAGLRQHLAHVDLDGAAAVTGIGLDAIRELAHDLATLKPASIDRREGTIHLTTGTQVSRAVALLNAVTGNVDVSGGLTFNSVHPWDWSLGIKARPASKPFWAEEFPLALDASGKLPEAILGKEDGRDGPDGGTHGDGVVKALVCVASNPASMLPDTKRSRRALESLDLLIVDDLFMTETARLADYVLPGVTFFEKGEFETGPFKMGEWVKLSRPVVAPLGEARAEWRVFAELAARLGHPELSAFADEAAVMRRVFVDSGRPELEPEELAAGRLLGPVRQGDLLRKGFNTPSGKIRLGAHRFPDLGVTAYPEPVDACPVSEGYPLRLITGARVSAYTHSQHRNIPRLRRRCPEPVAELAPELAATLELAEGDTIQVETALGAVALPVSIAAGMNPNTVSILHGWGGKYNSNRLISLDRYDPLSATPAYKAVPCRIVKPQPPAA
ncbi:MAG: molybdopterin-dependent oxidoreductase [Deferrisomatales bacterium]|nr:molybdopterin-dependent oxidoreductase [Deferrisomatales bacterium]